MIGKDFKSIIEIFTTFPTEQACIEHLEKTIWDGNIVSPFDETSKVYKCKNNRYWCVNTRKYFNAKTNTIFENTKVPLVKWFVAIYLNATHKKGISSLQLSQYIDVTQKTAWFMLHRIRKCYGQPQEDAQLQGEVEIDETFVGGKNKNRHWDKKVKNSQGRAFKDKTPVFGMLQRGGKVIAKVVSDTKAQTLRPIIDKHIVEESTVYTDEWFYGNLHEKYTHKQVFHVAKVYAVGDVYTNTIEGFWSILKRGYIGVYHYISRKHLQRYVDEFCFRYNTRDYSQYQRFNLLLCNTKNRRLKYKDLIN
ncbi:IS1595 family transposase [Dysgonomonas sp. 216]|uniref:IS1595 family transposase n=1 Tax=Dysgonomonas sp. 216 TaxID=2302934 RepID=UPI0013D3A773|nr:IS1595 family transposase [Dysgonomonas sp. 216]NDW17568.1 IS1595 family transposase [Dysgonomonas sp. 216]